jgi:hypothetical protein
MSRTTVSTVLRNLALLGLGALPLFFVLVWFQSLVGGGDESRRFGYVLETGGFYYLTYVVYVLLGGLAHQALLLLLPASLGPSVRRIAAVLLTVVIPLVLIVMGERLTTITDFAIPLIVSLGVYGFLTRFPALSAP